MPQILINCTGTALSVKVCWCVYIRVFTFWHPFSLCVRAGNVWIHLSFLCSDMTFFFLSVSFPWKSDRVTFCKLWKGRGVFLSAFLLFFFINVTQYIYGFQEIVMMCELRRGNYSKICCHNMYCRTDLMHVYWFWLSRTTVFCVYKNRIHRNGKCSITANLRQLALYFCKLTFIHLKGIWILAI